MSTVKAFARHKSRCFLVQALYQWQLSGNDLTFIAEQFHQEKDMKKADGEYFNELLKKVVESSAELDANFASYLDRSVLQLDPVELAILRLSSYEMLHRPDVPYRVVINEALELAKMFGAEGSHRYINGVLDKLAKKVRIVEMKNHVSSK